MPRDARHPTAMDEPSDLIRRAHLNDQIRAARDVLRAEEASADWTAIEIAYRRLLRLEIEDRLGGGP